LIFLYVDVLNNVTDCWLWENWHIPENIWASGQVCHFERFE